PAGFSILFINIFFSNLHVYCDGQNVFLHVDVAHVHDAPASCLRAVVSNGRALAASHHLLDGVRALDRSMDSLLLLPDWDLEQEVMSSHRLPAPAMELETVD